MTYCTIRGGQDEVDSTWHVKKGSILTLECVLEEILPPVPSAGGAAGLECTAHCKCRLLAAAVGWGLSASFSFSQCPSHSTCLPAG